MDPLTRDRMVRQRALDVLGVEQDQGPADEKRLRYHYHCRMLALHPDHNADQERAQDMAALANEAFALLTGNKTTPQLLLDEELVALVVGIRPDSLENMPSYEEWLRDQFYNMAGKSIWPS